MLGPGCQRLSGSKVKQKQKTGGPEGGPGPQGSSGLVPRWGEGGGRDGSVGRPDGRRAPSVGLTNGAVGAVGVGCTVAWAAKMHALSLLLRGFGYEIAPAARCFCFLNRGPGPSEAASQRPLTERSKTLGPAWWAHAIAQQMWRCAPMLARPPQAARRRLRTIAVHESCADRCCGANDSRSQSKAFEQDARSGCSRSTHIAPALRPRAATC